jgi:phosphopantetheinyl transferase
MRELTTPWSERILVLQREGGEELEAFFSPAELVKAAGFRLQKRRDEWLLGRLAAKRLAARHEPRVDPRDVTVRRGLLTIAGEVTDWRVSLSHSGDYAGAIIAREPVGLDVQVVRSVPERMTHLFLTEKETQMMLGCRLSERVLHFWCAKEAAWKQRSAEFATLKQLPLTLLEASDDALRFDTVQTRRLGDVIVAVTL